MAARAALACALLCCVFGAVGGIKVGAAVQRTRAGGRGYTLISVPSHLIEVSPGEVSSLAPSLSIGNLIAYEPAKPANRELFLFLAGSENGCEKYAQLLELVGRSMRTLCVPYDNRVSVGQRCTIDNDCYTRLRKRALDGDFNDVRGNNIESRLASALSYLAVHESGDWGRHVDKATGRPLWASIRAAGHSQGAGMAAMIGYAHAVARVVQFSGVCDHADWPEKMAPPATPAERWFAIGQSADRICAPAVQRQHWLAEGLFKEGQQPLELRERIQITPEFLGKSHAVISHIHAPDCEKHRGYRCILKDHESVAGMHWGSQQSPYANGLWQALVGI